MEPHRIIGNIENTYSSVVDLCVLCTPNSHRDGSNYDTAVFCLQSKKVLLFYFPV